jgi:hypothetical protein
VRLMIFVTSVFTLTACATTAPREDNYLQAMMAGVSPLGAAKVSQIAANASKFPLGSRQNPVRAAMPEGQRAYLGQLRCADGKPPVIVGRSNIGPGIYDSIVDAYDVDCGVSAPGKQTIYMDMYHRGYVESQPVAGFTIGNIGKTL